VVARKRVSRVSRNAPILPSKQAHALSPLGANFTPPFFCCNGYGLTQNGNKIMVKFGFEVTFLYPCTGTTPFWQGNGSLRGMPPAQISTERGGYTFFCDYPFYTPSLPVCATLKTFAQSSTAFTVRTYQIHPLTLPYLQNSPAFLLECRKNASVLQANFCMPLFAPPEEDRCPFK